VLDSFVIMAIAVWLLGTDLLWAALAWAMFVGASAGGLYIFWFVHQDELRKGGWKW